MSRRWVIDPTQLNEDTGTPGKLVPASEYVRPYTTGNVMVMTDLWMDGTAATDGADIGSRRKRNEYMKRHALIDANDMGGQWQRNAKERDRVEESTRRQDVINTLKGRR